MNITRQDFFWKYENRIARTFNPGFLLVGEVFGARADDYIHIVDTENLQTQQPGVSCRLTLTKDYKKVSQTIIMTCTD